VLCSVTFPHLRRALGGSLLLAVLALVGCSKPMGTVSGKVTYKGAPVTSGEVQFIDQAKGKGASGKLDGEGKYTLSGQLEAGKYKVYIQAPVPEQLPPGQVSKRPPFTVPPKFQDPGQTPVTKEVKAGANDIPIDLTD